MSARLNKVRYTVGIEVRLYLSIFCGFSKAFWIFKKETLYAVAIFFYRLLYCRTSLCPMLEVRVSLTIYIMKHRKVSRGSHSTLFIPVGMGSALFIGKPVGKVRGLIVSSLCRSSWVRCTVYSLYP